MSPVTLALYSNSHDQLHVRHSLDVLRAVKGARGRLRLRSLHDLLLEAATDRACIDFASARF